MLRVRAQPQIGRRSGSLLMPGRRPRHAHALLAAARPGHAAACEAACACLVPGAGARARDGRLPHGVLARGRRGRHRAGAGPVCGCARRPRCAAARPGALARASAEPGMSERERSLGVGMAAECPHFHAWRAWGRHAALLPAETVPRADDKEACLPASRQLSCDGLCCVLRAQQRLYLG